ncbi:MAG: hypothetical protein U0U46_08110 [Saprospiraceae bacterium]
MASLQDLLNDITGGIAKVQSPYLYLQAAGSDKSDYSADGIHLRWELMRTIGDHLPKGHLAGGVGAAYPASHGFNKPADFVELLRVPYHYRYPCTVNFTTDLPVALIETGPTRVWKFDTLVPSTPAGEHCEVLIRFNDTAQYDAIRSTVNPGVSPYPFIAQYTGIVEAQVTNRLCFVIRPSVRVTGHNPALRMEAVSTPENVGGAELFISCRRVLGVRENDPTIPGEVVFPPRPIVDNVIELQKNEEPREDFVMAENIVYFRFDYADCVPTELRLETYEQFILGSIHSQKAQWQAIADGFSLTDNDAVAFGRLEDSALYSVHHKWPRYYGAQPGSGLFTTSVPNYQSKWNPTLAPLNEPNDLNGLKRAVINYLILSQSPANVLAVAALQSDAANDQAAFDISYLQMLKLAALDYHIARMLGLGYIDANLQQGKNEAYVYLSIYHTTAPLEAGSPAFPFTHLYMTLPTSRGDYRLPPAPVQGSLGFGISVDNGTGTPLQLTDANGYTPFDDARIIHLNVEPYDPYQAFGPFFQPPKEFCSCQVTRAVFYGVKYKLLSEANYRIPEISHDEEFSDPSGVFETTPVAQQLIQTANMPNPALFTHEEKEEGDHAYAIYGINWFSRPSPLSNVQTADTHFPVRRTLLPPANLSVQLIQPEDPQILTTATEQQMFVNQPAGDQTLIRATFEWNHNHYLPQKNSATNQYADKAQFFFRQEPPRPVAGQVKSVTVLSDTQVEVRTQSYLITSVTPAETVIPLVLSGDEPRFIGSLFVANQVPYVVDAVSQSLVSGEGAVFLLKKQLQSTVSELNTTNQFSASVQVSFPAAGDRFLVVENMNEPTNWNPAGSPLAKEVQLVNFLHNGVLYTETVPTPDSAPAVRNIGGIYESALVTEFLDVYPGDAMSPDIPGADIPGSRTGLYTVLFDNFLLADHPDPDVSWYKGSVRILEDAAFLPNPNDPTRTTPERKVLEVWKIETAGSQTKLTVYDPTLDVTPGTYSPRNLYVPVQKGAGVLVNFHPAYRVYLSEQPGVLDENTTLPAGSAESRQTYLSIRSVNTVIPLESFLHTPVVMPSRRVLIPLPPGEPLGPQYATRPNFYGKATWTMDVDVTVNANREPYALVFYRANERTVLDTLYKGDPTNSTVESVLTALKTLSPADASFEANRWRDLLRVANLHPTDHGFNEYTAGGFRFPNPDNPAYVIPGTNIRPFDGSVAPLNTAPGSGFMFTLPDGSQRSMLEVIRQCIDGAFLPLTESPVLYRFIKTGTQTSSKKPVIRDSNNALLPFSSPLFDPSPMAVKHSGGAVVRFTDYTLDGAARNLYFYYAAEMNDEMKFSDRSPIAGPIKLVNAYPAERPGIRKITTILADPTLRIIPSIKIELDPYLESENIRRIKLYRANNAADASSVRSMTLAAVTEVTNAGAIEIADTFKGLPFPLFGDPLFYRLVALREITNEFDQLEDIPSQASELGMALLADVINPPAPRITAVIGTVTAIELQNVTLKWEKTAYNATYYLYEMTSAGNWHVIFQVKSNDDSQLQFTLPQNIAKVDANGNVIYRRFRVKVENASGLFNLSEQELTL